jgi:hypothetical protein
VADDEGVVAIAFRFDRIADHFSGAAKFDDRMGVIVVRRDPSYVDGCAGIDNRRKVTTQPFPISFAVLLVDEALIPNTDRVQEGLQGRFKIV